MFSALERFAGGLSSLFIVVASVFLVVMASLGAADVFAFNVFGVPVPAANEISSTMLPIVVMLAMSYAQRQRAHIRVDIVSSRFPPPLQWGMEVLQVLIGLVVFSFFAIGAWELAMKSIEISESAIAAIRFPVWPAKLIFALGAIAVIVELLAQLVDLLRRRTGVPAPGQDAR